MRDEKGFQETLKVYGLREEHVFAQRFDETTGEIVIVTHGGAKIRHKKGAPASVKLTDVQKTGIPPKQEMIWDSKLGQRRPRDAEARSEPVRISGEARADEAKQ
jgi:hypothetical protein